MSFFALDLAVAGRATLMRTVAAGILAAVGASFVVIDSPRAQGADDAALANKFTGKTWMRSRSGGGAHAQGGGYETWRMKFAPGGRLVGEFQVIGTGGILKESGTDSGQWLVKDGQVCMQWKKWTRGRSVCYRVACTQFGCTAKGPNFAAGRFTLK